MMPATLTDQCPACGADVSEGVPHAHHETTITTGAEATPPVPTNYVVACSCGKRIHVATINPAFAENTAERHKIEAPVAERDARGEQDCGCTYRVAEDWTVTDELTYRCEAHERQLNRGEKVTYRGLPGWVEFHEGDTVGIAGEHGGYVECDRDDAGLVRR